MKSYVFASEAELAKRLDADHQAWRDGTLKTYSMDDEFRAMNKQAKDLAKISGKHYGGGENAVGRVPLARSA
jgi:hypothetical protein